MARWTGFSDEELQRLKIASDEQIPSHMMRQGRPQAAVTPQRSKGRGERGARGAALGTRASEQSKPQTMANMKRDQEPRLEKGEDIKAKVDVSIKEEISKQKETGEEVPPIGDVELLRVGTSSPTVEDCGMRQEISRLEQLKQQQKIMEEHNKQKHAELIQQLAVRTRRTAAESVKLQKLQRELQNLDFALANDVSILRSRIDQAECAYSSARKQYDRAEAKFVAAKMELHRRVEVKELLTEHLCLVIGQSEARKSSRLDELTRKLKDWDWAEDEKESAKDINQGAEVEEVTEGETQNITGGGDEEGGERGK
uniref:RAB6-interacting golgin n=1 Tax=Eptatretus burgeri TaxID=7764 RepID=A0A8C4QS20_EPTBU